MPYQVFLLIIGIIGIIFIINEISNYRFLTNVVKSDKLLMDTNYFRKCNKVQQKYIISSLASRINIYCLRHSINTHLSTNIEYLDKSDRIEYHMALVKLHNKIIVGK